MADLLAHDQIAPRGSVVFRIVEISIVYFRCAFSYMASGNPDLCKSEPAVIAVGLIADLHYACSRSAVLV